MLDLIVGINFIPIIAAVFVNVIIGSFWYSPYGFGKLWGKLTGLNMMDLPKAEANRGIGLVFIGAVVQAYVLAVLVYSLHVTTVGTALLLGFLIWAAFIGSATIGDSVYARRGWKLWSLNSKFFLVVLLINSVLLALWR